MIPEAFETGFLPAQEPLAHLWRDDFDRSELDFCWNFLRNPCPADWSLRERGGYLRLRGSPVALSDWDAPAFLGRRQDEFQVRAACLLDFAPFAENEEAGLSVFMNSYYHYDLAVSMRGGERCAVVRKSVGDLHQEIVSQPLPPGPVRLSLDTDGIVYRFYCAAEGSEEVLLATGLARLLCAEMAAPLTGSAIWTGIYLGLYASGNGQPCRAPADFDWFEYGRL